MTCTECGMSREEWLIEDEINPNGRPCCDAQPAEDEEELMRQAMAEYAELKVREILAAALRRAPSPREVRRALAVWETF